MGIRSCSTWLIPDDGAGAEMVTVISKTLADQFSPVIHGPGNIDARLVRRGSRPLHRRRHPGYSRAWTRGEPGCCYRSPNTVAEGLLIARGADGDN
jgi:hypothetical protein